MDRPFISVNDLIGMMAERGDNRSESTRYVHVHRALHSGAFPSARKLNPGQTSPWLIPTAQAMQWLEGERAAD